jgi:D-alanine-D-alanine ligase-like ATP-grasp enzyme
MSLELIAPKDINGDRILSKEVKSDDTETYSVVLDRKIKFRVEKLALEAFEALGARDYGRIDIRLDSAGNPQFLEANLIPSLLENYGNFPKACMLNESITFGTMLQRIIDLANTRKPTSSIVNIPNLAVALRISNATI